jgi:hypothetical protein
MAELKSILRQCLESYAGKALNGMLYLMSNSEETIFSITSIAQVRGETLIETGIVARLEDEKIIIERDVSNKPLVDALEQVGISRQQIILAYQGEAHPIGE